MADLHLVGLGRLSTIPQSVIVVVTGQVGGLASWHARKVEAACSLLATLLFMCKFCSRGGAVALSLLSYCLLGMHGVEIISVAG
jgi:hypothetical protein